MKRLCLILTLVLSLIVVSSMCAFAADKKSTTKKSEEAKSAKKKEATEKSAKTKETLIDVNKATLKELEILPGIGPKLAQAIIDSRPYEYAEDLLEVKGIGEKKLAAIIPLISLKTGKPEQEKEKAEEKKGTKKKKETKQEKEAEEKKATEKKKTTTKKTTTTKKK